MSPVSPSGAPLGRRPLARRAGTPRGLRSEVEPGAPRRHRPRRQVDPDRDPKAARPLRRQLDLQAVDLTGPGDLAGVPEDLDGVDLAAHEAGAAAEADDP